MGVPLFIRRRNGLELTRAGRELFEISDKMVTIEQLIEEKVESYNSLADGHLRIVATAPRPAMPIIQKFTTLFPGVKLDFSLFNWTICTRLLRQRQVDIAIFAAPELIKGYYVRELGQSCFRAFLRHDHPLATRKKISLRELAKEYVILPEDGSLTQRVVNQKTAECNIVLERTMKITTFPVLKEAVLHGIGIGILLEDALYPTNDLVSIPIEELPETYADCLVTHTEKRDLRLVQQFLTVAGN